VDAVSGKKFDTVNPTNGETITQVAEGELVIFLTQIDII
jgi:hypothetical protein